MTSSDADTLLDESETNEATLAASRSSIDSRSAVDLGRATLRLEDGIRYAPRKPLGQGGMGVVELSTDRLIGRDVAIKTLRPQLSDNAHVSERFLREARIQGQLEHPAIVPVYDLGHSDAGTLYFAMKRVKGRTLRDILDARARGSDAGDPRFTQRRLLSAFSQICQAVAFAHSRAVIHRDLKPENLMFGEHGEVYVLDWGIARLHGIHDNDNDDDHAHVEVELGGEQTRQGTIVGTVGYLSPEQAAGDHEQVDERSDVWSLGAILFELLCGRPLIERGSPTEMLTRTILGVDNDPAQLDPDVAPELAALCMSATATDHEQRLASASALSEGIERYLDGDRDAQMRRAKSDEHTDKAEQAAHAAFESDDLELHKAAARESGIALALDPNNLRARKLLLELLTRPPKHMPEAARAKLDEDRARTLRSYYRESIVAIAVYTPLLLLVLLFHPYEPWFVFGALATGAAYVILCVFGLRNPTPHSYRPLMLMLCVSLAMLFMARLFTPLLVLPVLAAVNSLVSLGYRGAASRWMFLALGTMPVLGAALLEIFGVWSPTMVWADGVLHLRGGLSDFGDSVWVIPVLVLASVFPVGVGVTLTARIHRLSDNIARDAHVQRWQLEQLVANEG